MEIKPVYVFYGEDQGRIRTDVDFFRNYFAKEGCYTDSFDAAKIDVSEILMAAESNPLFGERRLIIVANTPWFGAVAAKEGKKEEPSYEAPLLAYLEDPNPDICLVFLANSADKRKKLTKAAAKCGTVREYKGLNRWELPDYVMRYCRKQGKRINGKTVDLLIELVGTDATLLNHEIEKLVLHLGERPTIEESDILAVVSRSSEADSFQFSDAVGTRDFSKVLTLSQEMFAEMKPHEYMAFFGYLTNYIRLLMRIKELDEKHMSPDVIATTLKIHSFRIKKGIPAARNYSMEELIAALNHLAVVDYKMKSGQGDFKPLLTAALLKMVKK